MEKIRFGDWLISQHSRTGHIGLLASLVKGDRTFPRSANRLHILLKYCGINAALRDAMKFAHREWRTQR